MPKHTGGKKKTVSAAQRLLNLTGYVAPMTDAEHQAATKKLVRDLSVRIDNMVAVEEATGENGVATAPSASRKLGLMYTQRSDAYLARSLPDEAIQDAELALEASPDLGKAYAARAAVLLDLFKNKEALADLDKAEELDPSLTSTLAEQRLRAQGKKWVHNCYLKKRMRLMNHHKCDFVIIIPGEYGEDEVIEPWHGSTFHAQCALKLLLQPEASGSQTEGLLPMFCHFFHDTPFYQKVGEKQLRAIVHQQFRAEFGPDKSFEDPTDTDAGLFSSSLRSSLHHTVWKVRERGVISPGMNRCLYPGRPKWLELGKETFIVNIFWERCFRPKDGRTTDTGTDNELKNSWPPMVDTCKYEAAVAALETYRERFKGRESKCHRCEIPITDPDPHECMCGEIYCSETCSWNHVMEHQRHCMGALGELNRKGAVLFESINMMKSMTDHQAANFFTMWYWELVFLGYYPCKDEPDFAALWRSRNYSGDDAWEKEIEFYKEHEWSHFKAELTIVKNSRPSEELCGCNSSGGKLATHQADNPLRDCIHRMLSRFGTFIPRDSCARVVSKLKFYESVVYPAAASFYPDITPPETVARDAIHFFLLHQQRGPSWNKGALKIMTAWNLGNKIEVLPPKGVAAPPWRVANWPWPAEERHPE